MTQPRKLIHERRCAWHGVTIVLVLLALSSHAHADTAMPGRYLDRPGQCLYSAGVYPLLWHPTEPRLLYVKNEWIENWEPRLIEVDLSTKRSMLIWSCMMPSDYVEYRDRVKQYEAQYSRIIAKYVQRKWIAALENYPFDTYSFFAGSQMDQKVFLHEGCYNDSYALLWLSSSLRGRSSTIAGNKLIRYCDISDERQWRSQNHIIMSASLSPTHELLAIGIAATDCGGDGIVCEARIFITKMDLSKSLLSSYPHRYQPEQ